MFYAHFVLAKKGPLASVWLAAHFKRKLSRIQLRNIELEKAVDQMMKPPIKISLRTTGHLLIGIVRIFAQKTDYTLIDLEHLKAALCRTLESKYKLSPSKIRVKRRHVIRPENAGEPIIEEEGEERPEDDVEMPNMADFDHPPENAFHGRARAESITMEDLIFPPDRTFEFEDAVPPMAAEDFDDFFERSLREMREQSVLSDKTLPLVPEVEEMELGRDHHMSPAIAELSDRSGLKDAVMDEVLSTSVLPDGFEPEAEESILGDEDNTQDIQLDPLSESQLAAELNAERLLRSANRRPRRPKRLFFDEDTVMDDDVVRKNLKDYSDLCVQIEMAPPTKRLCKIKEITSAEAILNEPATAIGCVPVLAEMYKEHLVPHSFVGVADLTAEEISTPEDVRRSMGLSDEVELAPSEMISNPGSRADSRLLDFPEGAFIPEEVAANEFMEPQPLGEMANHSLFDQSNFGENAPLDMNISMNFGGPLETDSNFGDENVDPLLREPAAKRPRTEAELRESQMYLEKRVANADLLIERIRQKERQIGNVGLNAKFAYLQITFADLIASDLPAAELKQSAARDFYALLELRKNERVTVQQSLPFGPIAISTRCQN